MYVVTLVLKEIRYSLLRKVTFDKLVFSEKSTPKVKLDLSLQNMTLKKRKESSSPVAMVRKRIIWLKG